MYPFCLSPFPRLYRTVQGFCLTLVTKIRRPHPLQIYSTSDLSLFNFHVVNSLIHCHIFHKEILSVLALLGSATHPLFLCTALPQYATSQHLIFACIHHIHSFLCVCQPLTECKQKLIVHLKETIVDAV